VARVHSVAGFLVVALVVTLTPGPATALMLRVAARDGRRAAIEATVGNSVGVLVWGCLSALGVSSLIVASQIAYDVLRVVGAAILIVLGLRSLLRRHETEFQQAGHARVGWRSGLVTALANPKLAVFFIALLPQFLSRGSATLPMAMAMAMAGAIVVYDLLWFGTLIWVVDRASTLLRPKVRAGLERLAGGAMIGFGVGLITEASR
jgi:threonine/homoserine/homoserine lactone efflux protein